ncbi:hypothetical protein SAMN05443665_100967 [Actinomadura meyerae]|uniref:SPW repeat-containing protein n=1 Tax=Actinomadura meyerae TaxID=240840 RepID=A0A239HAG2_9ACTN|nr:hypothetical protein [Actinomadura meyerae]SNS78115.1 hypothetical protein SAMN05443665_100967 [Actinomadura meyerae]
MTTTEAARTALPAASPARTARRAAAACSVLAALVHYAVVPEHLDEWWAYGVFFSAIGMFQLMWAVLAHTGDERPVLLSGLAVNLGVLALWAVSRTSGLPFGPEPGEAEPAGVLDVLSGAAELVLIAGIVLALRGSRRRPAGEPADPAAAEAAAGAEPAGEGG